MPTDESLGEFRKRHCEEGHCSRCAVARCAFWGYPRSESSAVPVDAPDAPQDRAQSQDSERMVSEGCPNCE